MNYRTYKSRTREPDKARRIAMVVLRNDSNDARLVRQAKTLCDARFSVSIYPLYKDTGYDVGGAQNRWIRFTGFKFIQMNVWRSLRHFKPDLIVAHEPEALAVAAPYARRFGLPLLYDAHEFYDAQRGVTDARKAWLARLYKKSGRAVSRMITVSPGLARLYRTHHPHLPDCRVICNAAIRLPNLSYDGRLHDAAGVSRNTPILLYQGGMWADRGISHVVEISRHLPQGWVTVLMGDGPLTETLKMDERLVLLSARPQAELLRWTAGATLGMIPYEANNLNHIHCLPNKLWEFPIAGVPIVARALPDMKSVIEQWDIGLTVPQNDTPSEIAQCIAELSNDDIETMKKSCQKFSQIENWDKYSKRYLSIIQSML